MKILYIANERCDAQVAATALHGIAPNVTVLWASQFDQAATWIHEHRDLAALVVEAEVNSRSCTSFLEQVRGLGLRSAVVVIAPEETPVGIEPLVAVAYDYVVKNDSLFRDLPVAVARAIERAQTPGLAPRDRRHLESVPDAPMGERVDGPREAVTDTEEIQQPPDAEPERLPDNPRRFQNPVERETASGRMVSGRPLTSDVERPNAELAAAIAARDALAQTLAESQAALDRTECARDSDRAAAVDRLAQCQMGFDARLAEAVGTSSRLEHRVDELDASFHQREQSWAAERRAAAERQAKLEELAQQERATRANLEQKIAHAQVVLDAAEQQHRSAITTAAGKLAERQAQYEVAMARAAATWDMVDEQLREAAIEVERARRSQASVACDAERLSRRDAELSLQLAEVNATHNILQNRLAVAETALEASNERVVRERLTATERQTELEAQVELEVQNRHSVDELLVRAQAARDDAEERHASAMTTAAKLFAEHQTQFKAELTEAVTAREDLGNQVRDLEMALGRAQEERESNAAAAARREAELTSMLTEATTIRSTLEHRLAGTATAFKDADERAARERLAAVKRAAQREADLDGLVHQERAARATVEENLAQAEVALSRAVQQHASAMTTAATELGESQARFEVELSQTAAAHGSLERQLLEREVALERALHEQASAAGDVERLTQRETDLACQLAEAAATRGTLELQLADAATASRDADRRATRERVEADERQRDVETRLAQEIETRETLESEIAETRSAAVDAERWFREETASMTARASEHATRLEQLQGQLQATIQELDDTRARREVLHTEAERVPQLQMQLDESRAETRWQFERGPLPSYRCTRDGALTHANGALALLLGARTADELPGADFVAAVFELPDDLSWLIERCLSTRARESVETTWRGGNGGRLVVRLSAFASASDVIEIVAEDLTSLRALQDRLGQAHRMEAVGRLASEVAVTCGNLLRDVHQDAQQWLTTVSGDSLRDQGERLLEGVTRATSFLRQLAAYGEEETSALAPVDLSGVLRDLEPVLKRVAGDDVVLELPKASFSLNVDVRAERVERLFVNLASYGRERMPFGGRLRIELASVVVDRTFIAKYPNVRQGPHALITVTEVRRAMPAQRPLRPGQRRTAPIAERLAADKPGVDLGALQGLIRECSGHLWMTVEPPGDMVAKIHLPLRGAEDRAGPQTPAVRASPGRTLAR